MLESLVRRYLYYPLRLPLDATPPPWVRGCEEVTFESDDGNRLHGLHWPAPVGRPTVLYLHGNAQHVFDWALVSRDLAALETGLLLIDYPGYGKSSGRPSEEGLNAAGLAAMDFLDREADVPSGRVVVLGKSLGGGVATFVATHRELLGLVLESTFRSIPAVVRRLLPIVPAGLLLNRERYPSIERITDIKVPVLVVHGTHDELIPVAEGQALYEAANDPKRLYLVKGAGHNDVSDVAGAAYGETLRSWLDGITG